MDDRELVTHQLGREPRGPWRAVVRCSFDRPAVIATAPVLDEGSPFPTLYYLTCPHLAGAISIMESHGAVDAWHDVLEADGPMRERLAAADAAYRTARAVEGGGEDPTPDVGVAGQRDPLGTKCLHAHVAAYLAGLDDPVGEGVLSGLVRECADDRCGRWERHGH